MQPAAIRTDHVQPTTTHEHKLRAIRRPSRRLVSPVSCEVSQTAAVSPDENDPIVSAGGATVRDIGDQPVTTRWSRPGRRHQQQGEERSDSASPPIPPLERIPTAPSCTGSPRTGRGTSGAVFGTDPVRALLVEGTTRLSLGWLVRRPQLVVRAASNGRSHGFACGARRMRNWVFRSTRFAARDGYSIVFVPTHSVARPRQK